MNRDIGAAAPQGAYYDEGMKEWYRPSWKGRPEVVVGPEDRTGRQVTLVLDCWACRDREPHSQAYHDAQMHLEWKRIGGLPRGRIVEIYGHESSGKTTLASHVMAEAQRLGGICVIIDAEHAFDPDFAQRVCGVNVSELLICQPDSGEQALEIAEMMIGSSAVDVVVIDSVAALIPRQEIEKDMGDSLPGLQARLMSQAMRKLTAVVSKSRCCVIFINQLREKIGIAYGNPEVTPGGRALKFYASVRLEIRKMDLIKQGSGDALGLRAKVTVRKNKVAPPFKSCELDIMWTEGISKTGSLIDVGTEMGIVKKSGAYYAYGETKMGLGRENVKEFLRQRPEIMAALEAEVRASAANAAGTPGGKEERGLKESDLEVTTGEELEVLEAVPVVEAVSA